MILCLVIGLVLSTMTGSGMSVSRSSEPSKIEASTKHKFNWNLFITAISYVESNNKVNAKNGKCIGPLQISPILVKECNDILKKQKSNKKFRLSDRKNISKSKEMFIIIQEHYNPEHNLRKAAKIWNAGSFSKNTPSRYIEKVMTKYKSLH